MSRRRQSSESDKEFFQRANDYANALLGRKRRKKTTKTTKIVFKFPFEGRMFRVSQWFRVEFTCLHEDQCIYVKYVARDLAYFYLLHERVKDSTEHLDEQRRWVITKYYFATMEDASKEACLRAIVFPVIWCLEENPEDRFQRWVAKNPW